MRCAARVLLTLGMVGASGCAHQVYEPHADTLVMLPDAFVMAAQDAAPAEQVCHVLTEGALASFAARVAAGNLDLRAASARLRLADALATQARAPRLPRFDGQAEFSRGDAATGSSAAVFPGAAPSIAQTWQASLAASFEIDAWGRVGANADAATLDAYASGQLLEALSVTVHAQMLETWFSLVAEQRLIDLLSEQAANSSRFLELTQLRFGLGQTPAQDVGRQRQNLLGLQGELARSRERAALLRSRLAALAGGTLQDLDIPLPRELPELPESAEPGLPGTLAARRPDVRAAMASLAAADQRTAAAAADRLPRLTLTASLLSVEQIFGDLLSDTLWQTGLAAGAPVFDAGASRARVDAAEASAEAQLYAWATTLLTAYREVEDALTRNHRQAEFIDRLDAQLREAERVLTLTRDFYRLGQGDYLDVISALLSQQTLQRQQLAARLQQFINRITLCRALGVGPATAAVSESSYQGDRS